MLCEHWRGWMWKAQALSLKRQDVHPSFSLLAPRSPGWGTSGWGWSATLAEKLAGPPPRPGRRDSRGGRGEEPALGNLLPGGGGGPHGPSRRLCVLPEVLAAAASVVSAPGLGPPGAWGAQSRAGGRWRARRGHRRGAHSGGSALGLSARGAGAARPGPARWGRPASAPAVGPDWGPAEAEPSGRHRLRCPRHRGAPSAVGGGVGGDAAKWGEIQGSSHEFGVVLQHLFLRGRIKWKSPLLLGALSPRVSPRKPTSWSQPRACCGRRVVRVTWILKYFRDTCPEWGSESTPCLSIGVCWSVSH